MADSSIATLIGFFTTTVLALWFFYNSYSNRKLSIGIILWMILTAILGVLGFYGKQNTLPPRFIFLLAPGLAFVLLLFFNKHTRLITDRFDLKTLTILHIIRIPVEIVLYSVYLDGLIPNLMTFDGYNFDIISGITAPLIYYLVFVKNWLGKTSLLIWNIVCLILLINILTIAILSAQTPFQQLAFEQPNIGVTYFPFVWLPAVIVPIVFFAHMTSIRRLLNKNVSLNAN